MAQLSTCNHCERPIAWLNRSTTGTRLALEPEPVELAAAHPDAPLYAITRTGSATRTQDIYKPPELAYLAHRCSESLDEIDTLQTARKQVEALTKGYHHEKPFTFTKPTTHRKGETA